MNYQIVVFKNKTQKRIINKFNTSKKALEYFESHLTENEKVPFEVRTENGNECKYEIALLEKKGDTLFPIFTKDEMGRNIKLEFDNSEYNIIKISSYKEPEKIKDYQTGNKISFTTFINNYLSKEGIKLVSKLNNKIIVQNDDSINLFVLKCESDALRFMEVLTNRFVSLKRGDCMFVLDTMKQQKKYLYTLLESKGFDRKFLYRKETTYSSGLRT
jgi:hypothetical protein